MPVVVHQRPTGLAPDTPLRLGVDEAGRGAVLGPLLYGAAYWPIAAEDEFAALGFNDSKALTGPRRTALFAAMTKHSDRLGWMTHATSAREISRAMLHRAPISLNVLSHDATMDMIEAVLASGMRVTECFIDTVGDPEWYQKRLHAFFNPGRGGGGGTAGRGWHIDFVVAKKADSLYKVVSAASIAAKVTRDRSLIEWAWDEPAFAHITRPTGEEDVAPPASPGAAGGEGDTPAPKRKLLPMPLMKRKGLIAVVEDDEDEDSAGGDAEDVDGAQSSGAEAGAGAREVVATTKKGAKRARSEPPRLTCMHPSTSASGYPSDPFTKAWMKTFLHPVFGWPSVARFSWAPAKDALEANGTAVEWPDDEAAAAGGGGQARLSNFFSAAAAAPHRSSWHRKRHLQPFDL